MKLAIDGNPGIIPSTMKPTNIKPNPNENVKPIRDIFFVFLK